MNNQFINQNFIYFYLQKGHIGRQMSNSSHRFSFSNILFYILCASSAGLIAAATGLPTFGDSSSFCTVVILGISKKSSKLRFNWYS